MSTEPVPELREEIADKLRSAGLRRAIPQPGWAGRLAAFDARIFGVDAWPAAVWKDIFSGPGRYIVYVRDGGGITALPDIAAVGGINVGEQADILTLAVAPRYRHRGLGSLLLRELIATARREGAQAVFLEVRSRDAYAQAFYRSHGFIAIREVKNYYADDSATIMSLTLKPRRCGTAFDGGSATGTAAT